MSKQYWGVPPQGIYDETVEPSRYSVPPTLKWKWNSDLEKPCWVFTGSTPEEAAEWAPQYEADLAAHLKKQKKRAKQEKKEQAEKIFTVPVPSGKTRYTDYDMFKPEGKRLQDAIFEVVIP